MVWIAPDPPPGTHYGRSSRGDGSANLYDDATGTLLGPVALHWRPDEIESDSMEADEPDPDPGTLALVAVAGIAVGVAGVKFAQHLKNQRRNSSDQSSDAAASPSPAGWYEVGSDPGRLRYWDGTAWTNNFAQKQGSPVGAPADWYPDPADATHLRYWDGMAWTQHVQPRSGHPATPADWYPDPADATQLRYWDGIAWTKHVVNRQGPSSALPGAAAPSTDVRPSSSREESRISMSAAEWQAHVRAWMVAGALEQELWRRLSHAHIKQSNPATLNAQREMERLTPEEGAQRIRLMLEARTSPRGEIPLTELLSLLSGDREADGRCVPVNPRLSTDYRRPVDGRG